MRRIQATFPSGLLDEVMDALLDLRLPCQITATETRFADGRIRHEQHYRGTRYVRRWQLRTQLEIVVSDKEAESVLGVLVAKIDRDRRDDSAVLISEVDDALRVRSGRRGEFAF
ncbi:MAG TPA: P-II family nitrogen regulator [Myxococcota bacterium]|nr:P-II family nitrogen regulator [Myxococcota bacterium]